MTEAVADNTTGAVESPVPQAGADNRGAEQVAAMLYGQKGDDSSAQQTQVQVQEGQEAGALTDEAPKEEQNTDQNTDQNTEEQTEEVSPELFNEYVENGVLNEKAAEALAQIAKEKGFSPEQAKVLAEMQVATQQAAISALQESIAKWEQEVVNDPEIGGEKLSENLAVAKRGAEAIGIDGLLDWLDETGLGSHPMIIKMLYKVGQMTAEAPTIKGKDSAERDARSIAEKLYKTG